MIKVALAAGHRNQDGGSEHEAAVTARLTKETARVMRAAGFDVRVVTPQDGEGRYPGGVSAVGAQVVRWARQDAWRADLFLEFHGQALGDPVVRGGFCIYPDAPGDVDADVRDKLGPAIADSIKAATGIPTRTPLSEKATLVGMQGSRLGVFAATAPLKDTCTRLLVEAWTYTNPQDEAIAAKPDFPDKVALAVTRAVAQFYGVPITEEPMPAPKPTPTPSKADAVAEAMNGVAHHLNAAEAAVEAARREFFELKKAIGR